MAISPGDTLPEATLLRIGADGPETVELSALAKGRKLLIFALPGAFTGTCTNAHVPSFIKTKDAFAEKGVDEIVCIAVNDPFVMDSWSRHTGGDKAGITFLADPDAAFTKAMGMNFTAPPVGFYDRSKRYAMVVEDGTVKALNLDESPGVCEKSCGEAMLELA
ncbi:MAG: peroxiredoxin [Sagittula sp.]|jgi:glutaredoxin/glutathione-dependent peroxiredoxin|uniref:peroxiredoxin n=1 Tax=unclassified Sagittula TaxID=2624628 RepID=UPI000C2D319C|nr:MULTISPECIES: peroxiredoxin [unclassified Sagittula]AUC52886.1 peroxiredoxin [Sagittula sp. P11]WHZ35852.1 peroxiredoxin [Sagittula sp. MA-2]